MRPKADRLAVAKFLRSFKRLVIGGQWRLADRKKNIDSMARLGLLPGDVTGVLLGLRIAICISFHEPSGHLRF